MIAIGLLEHYINTCIFCAFDHGVCGRFVGLGNGCWWARVGGPVLVGPFWWARVGGQWVR